MSTIVNAACLKTSKVMVEKLSIKSSCSSCRNVFDVFHFCDYGKKEMLIFPCRIFMTDWTCHVMMMGLTLLEYFLWSFQLMVVSLLLEAVMTQYMFMTLKKISWLYVFQLIRYGIPLALNFIWVYAIYLCSLNAMPHCLITNFVITY